MQRLRAESVQGPQNGRQRPPQDPKMTSKDVPRTPKWSLLAPLRAPRTIKSIPKVNQNLTNKNQKNNKKTDRQTDRPRDRETDRPTDRPTDRLADGPTDRLTDRQTDGPTDRQTDRPSDRLTDRPTDRQIDRPTDRQTRTYLKSLPKFRLILESFFKDFSSIERPPATLIL